MNKDIKVLINASVKEWYGCEDHIGQEGYGRYKSKGVEEFVVEVPADVYWYNSNKIADAFNNKMDCGSAFFRYKAIDVQQYNPYPPQEIELEF